LIGIFYLVLSLGKNIIKHAANNAATLAVKKAVVAPEPSSHNAPDK